MITTLPLVDAHPGDPITSEHWNNVVDALRLIVAAMNKNLGALAIKVRKQTDGNAIRGAIVTVKPTGDLTRPIRTALFAGDDVNLYQVSQLLPGPYDVVVEAAGFNTTTLPITMAADGSALNTEMKMIALETLFPMPNLFGLTLTQALAEVKAQEFQVISIIDSHGKDTSATAIPDDAKAARVLGQTPDPGTPIARNAPIQIHISAKAEFAERIKVPDLRGLTLEEAKAKLASVHLVLGETVTVRQTGPAVGPGGRPPREDVSI
jgi:hypothetical protein